LTPAKRLAQEASLHVHRFVSRSSLFAFFALALMTWLQVSAFQVDERLEENGVELVFDDDFIVDERPVSLMLVLREPRFEEVEVLPPPPVHLEREARPPSRS
jgi:hypothetical protein